MLQLADILTEFRLIYTARTLSDATIKMLTRRAVRYYSRFNPIMAAGEITTVALQQAYDVEDDCASVAEVEWWPSGSPYAALSFNAAAEFLPEAETNDWSLSTRIRRNIKSSLQADHVRGRWTMYNRQIKLWPIPDTDDTTIDYTYYTLHSLTAADGSPIAHEYTYIPADDMDILVDLIRAEWLLMNAGEEAIETDYSEGFGSEKRSHIPQNAARLARELRRGVALRYGEIQCAMLS